MHWMTIVHLLCTPELLRLKDGNNIDTSEIITNGCRILTVIGHDLSVAVEKSLQRVKTIKIGKEHFRIDLGSRAVERAENQLQSTYKSSGVDIEKGNRFVDHVKDSVKITYRDSVMSQLGAFGAFFDCGHFTDLILISSTDGLGTKLMLAIETELYENVGTGILWPCVSTTFLFTEPNLW